MIVSKLKLTLIFITAFTVSFAIIMAASFIHTQTQIAAILIIFFMYLGANTVMLSIGATIDKRWRYYFPGGVALGLGLGFLLVAEKLVLGLAAGALSFLILSYYGNYTRVFYENQIKIYIKPLVEKQVFALSFIFAVSCAMIVFINAPEVEKDILAKIAKQVDAAIKSDYVKPYFANPLLPNTQTVSFLISSSLGTYSKHIIAVLSFAAFWAFEIASRIVWYFFLLTLRPSFHFLKKSGFIKVDQKEVVKEILTI